MGAQDMGEPDRDEVRVEPARLTAAAQVCRDARDGLGRAVSDVEPETIAADKGLNGWASQRALQDLLGWWRDDLSKLGKRLDATAEGLTACADAYARSDAASAGTFATAERRQ